MSRVPCAPVAPSTAPAASVVRSAARAPNVGSDCGLAHRDPRRRRPHRHARHVRGPRPTSLAAHAAESRTTPRHEVEPEQQADDTATVPRNGLLVARATSWPPKSFRSVRPTAAEQRPPRRSAHGNGTPDSSRSSTTMRRVSKTTPTSSPTMRDGRPLPPSPTSRPPAGQPADAARQDRRDGDAEAEGRRRTPRSRSLVVTDVAGRASRPKMARMPCAARRSSRDRPAAG